VFSISSSQAMLLRQQAGGVTGVVSNDGSVHYCCSLCEVRQLYLLAYWSYCRVRVYH